jgi:hypothetical protein
MKDHPSYYVSTSHWVLRLLLRLLREVRVFLFQVTLHVPRANRGKATSVHWAHVGLLTGMAPLVCGEV